MAKDTQGGIRVGLGREELVTKKQVEDRIEALKDAIDFFEQYRNKFKEFPTYEIAIWMRVSLDDADVVQELAQDLLKNDKLITKGGNPFYYRISVVGPPIMEGD